MPTSITIAPFLTISDLINPGFPIAATSISASFVYFSNGFVLEWHIVTVAFFCCSNKATGFPTILLLPTTTACFPSILTPVDSISLIIPFGVAETIILFPANRLPMFIALKPSASLWGRIDSRTSFSSICFGKGSWTIIPWIFLSWFILSINCNNLNSSIFSGR